MKPKRLLWFCLLFLINCFYSFLFQPLNLNCHHFFIFSHPMYFNILWRLCSNWINGFIGLWEKLMILFWFIKCFLFLIKLKLLFYSVLFCFLFHSIWFWDVGSIHFPSSSYRIFYCILSEEKKILNCFPFRSPCSHHPLFLCPLTELIAEHARISRHHRQACNLQNTSITQQLSNWSPGGPDPTDQHVWYRGRGAAHVTTN